ncbi:MAG: recombinase family protein, partial [Thermocrispum sp.]
MSEHSKITASHQRRAAVVYVRQSTPGQVEANRESTARQYELAERAVSLGWPRAAVKVIDQDLGVSGASSAGRAGFAELAAEVGLGQVGIVLSLECSRLARNNADWYRLLDLAGTCDTLIADSDGIYHPALFNDRLLLGMKGAMSEAELHILRARLDGGIRNKAARGELRRGLPVGLVYGEADGEILLHPDEAVVGVIAAVFEQFAVCGTVRGVWLWLREQGLKFPLQPAVYVTGDGGELTWVEPTYHAVHNVLTHPGYAGAYTFGRTRAERYIGDDGEVRTRRVKLPPDQWEVLIVDHHQGFIDWEVYQANQTRIAGNIRPQAHEPGTGPVREGCALLQGLATCGTCGRKLAVYYSGKHKATPGYYCNGTGTLVEGRNVHHLRIGGVAIDTAVAETVLAALEPAALQACLQAAQQLEDGHDAALAQHRREVERARYAASKAERRYRAVDPDNRLVARGLETDWERSLTDVAVAERELARRETARPRTLTDDERAAILALGDDLTQVWDAETTTDKDRKQLLRTLLDEVNITVHRDTTQGHADLVVRFTGGAISELTVPIKRRPATIRTDEDTIELLRRLAVHYPDAQIAGILNRQGR